MLPLHEIKSVYQKIYSSNLRDAFFKEVNLYLDKSLYHYIISKSLLSYGNFSWGAITQYYANFFVISGLIRLHEHGYSRIGNSDFEIVHSASDYKVKKLKVEGLHRIVWKKYYSLFDSFDFKPDIFNTLYSPFMDGDYYYETNRRNNINYDPSSGYKELYSSGKTINQSIKEKTKDHYNMKNFGQFNEWIDLDNITQHRIRLLANIVSYIDSNTQYPVQAKDRLLRRKKLILRYENNRKYQKRYAAWLEGK